MDIICQLKNINLAFGTKIIFNNASLTIEDGQKYGLLGLNGQGKTSLFKIIEGKLAPDTSVPPFTFDKSYEYSVFHVPQEAPIPDEDISISEYWDLFHPEVKELKEQLKVIEDSGDYSDSNINKQQKIYEKLEHLNSYEEQQMYESYAKNFGLDDLNKTVQKLSGGERKKLLLALGLSTQKKLVLWDEPTNHLDLETIQKFETELSETRKTSILITHDRYLLGKVTTKIFHIERGQISTFKGSYQDYLTHLAEKEIERKKLLQKMSNTFTRELAWMRQGIKARGTRSKKRVENYENLTKEIENLKSQEKKQIEFEISKTKRKTKVLVQIENINFTIANKELFRGLSLSINKGDKIGLMGQNGVGKTTLLKLILGEHQPQKGNIKLADGLVIRYFEQNKAELPLNSTPQQYLGEGNDFVLLSTGERRHVVSYFESFMFNRNDINKPIETFSGGERSRLQLAKNLLLGGDIWIFDEPTNDLDLETLTLLEKKLSDFEGSLILISHDRAFLENITNKVWLLERASTYSTLESFEAGYTQVQSYLDLLQAEKEIKSDKELVVETKVKVEEPVKKELSPQDIAKINDEILMIEGLVEKISLKLSEFDYQEITPQKTRELSELQATQEKLEEKLLALYEKLT